jgi:hypothetical protein
MGDIQWIDSPDQRFFILLTSYVSPPFWAETAIPLLQALYRATT